RLTATGILLRSGREIEADVIVTATGLELEAFGGGTLSIDCRRLDVPAQTTYRWLMLAGRPNFSFTVGYIKSSCSLLADVLFRYMVRRWKTGEQVYSPRVTGAPADRLLLEFAAGYVKRSGHWFHRQGDDRPWRYVQNYLVENPDLPFGDVRKDMEF